ncbi:MAG: hypothetical protein E6I23_08035 [Chloroflexi bacterium]|nr:MAG: hypothetical protein E6I23_08035 [Chloroflexota bacterium]
MASSTRTKAPQRGSKSKSGRRLPPKVKSGPDIPLLPVAVGAILVALAIGLGIYAYANNRPTPTPSVAGVPCDRLEQTQVHYHAALQIIHDGVQVRLPGGIGIQGGEAAPTCFYWLHVHSAYPNVIHIESPVGDKFTLGQFLSVWDTWSRNSGLGPVPFDATHVASFTLATGEKLYVYVDASDGKGPQLFSGDPKSIVLTKHEVISLVISAEATPTPPPAFNWSSPANAQL